MAKPRPIKKLIVSAADLGAMSDDYRYAILLLGLLSNDANWLRKLLVKAVLGITEGTDPDGHANFALAALLATTLAGKIHEGWERITKGRLGRILDGIGMSHELGELRAHIDNALKTKTFLKIRNNIAFHYPDRKFDFQKLSQHLDDTDTVIYMAPEGYQGDVFSQISNLAGIEPLIALDSNSDYRIALKAVWEEVTNLTGLYCLFIAESMAVVLTKSGIRVSVEVIIIPDAPEANENPLRFFVHPPSDLEKMRELVNREDDTTLHAHSVAGEIDHAELTREIIARFPKILAELAK